MFLLFQSSKNLFNSSAALIAFASFKSGLNLSDKPSRLSISDTFDAFSLKILTFSVINWKFLSKKESETLSILSEITLVFVSMLFKEFRTVFWYSFILLILL